MHNFITKITHDKVTDSVHYPKQIEYYWHYKLSRTEWFELPIKQRLKCAIKYHGYNWNWDYKMPSSHKMYRLIKQMMKHDPTYRNPYAFLGA